MTPDFLERLDLSLSLELLEGSTPGDPARVGRFAVVRRLGAGASGVVHLAIDTELDRPVALKVLAPALARDTAAVERFAAEARVAGALEHPRIVPVHEVGRDGELAYIAMAYREGITLRERLRRGPLPVADAVRIATEVAEALAAAHRAGIVHRDIKPENVLLTARGACLLDFGIAKMAGQALTVTGLALGTPAYMSPEQTRGAAVDARTDLWALGVMLYEMLAGERPFRGDGTDALVFGVRHDTPVPLPHAVPAHVRRVVTRCLAKSMEARPASAEAVMAMLAVPDRPTRQGRRLAVALAAVACVAVAWRAGRPDRDSSALPLPVTATRIALVPFEVDSTAPPPEYLSSGLFDEVRDELGAALRERLVHSGSVRIARAQGDDLPAIARRFDARAIVTGRFRQRGDSLAVALAVHTPDGAVRWSDTIVAPLVATQSLAREVRDELLAALGESVPRAPSRRVDPLAHDLVLRSRSAERQVDAFTRRRAPALAEEAIARDPAYAPAYVQLALLLQGNDEARAGQRVRALVERALALDSANADGLNVLGLLAAFEDRDWSRGEALAARAVALQPSRPEHHAALAAVRLGAGRPAEALAAILRARETDPLTPFTWTQTAAVLLEARQPDAAIGAIRQSMALDNNWVFKANILGRAHLAAGQVEEAVGWLRQADPSFAGFEGRAVLAHALGRLGRPAEARAIAAQYETRARGGDESPADLAVIHLGLGDTARALHWLARVPARRGIRFFPTDPLWDPLRASPRFTEVVRQLGVARAVPVRP